MLLDRDVVDTVAGTFLLPVVDENVELRRRVLDHPVAGSGDGYGGDQHQHAVDGEQRARVPDDVRRREAAQHRIVPDVDAVTDQARPGQGAPGQRSLPALPLNSQDRARDEEHPPDRRDVVVVQLRPLAVQGRLPRHPPEQREREQPERNGAPAGQDRPLADGHPEHCQQDPQGERRHPRLRPEVVRPVRLRNVPHESGNRLPEDRCRAEGERARGQQHDARFAGAQPPARGDGERPE